MTAPGFVATEPVPTSSSQAPEAPVLELADVVKTYRGSPPVHALAGVSLHVADGRILLFLALSRNFTSRPSK